MTEEPVPTSEEPPKKRRGRPVGSKNKKTAAKVPATRKPRTKKVKILVLFAADENGREIWSDEAGDWFTIKKLDI